MKTSNSTALIVPPRGANSASTQDIRDIRDPVPIASGWMWLWITLAVLAVAAAVWWWLKRPKKAVVDPALFIPPHRRAKERLRRAEELFSDPYAFCSLVSDVLRAYLEERFDLHAPDRTTEEFLAELNKSSRLIEAHKTLLEEFLTNCDFVKFARAEPAEPQLRSLLESALRLIDETQEFSSVTSLPTQHATPPPAPISNG